MLYVFLVILGIMFFDYLLVGLFLAGLLVSLLLLLSGVGVGSMWLINNTTWEGIQAVLIISAFMFGPFGIIYLNSWIRTEAIELYKTYKTSQNNKKSIESEETDWTEMDQRVRNNAIKEAMAWKRELKEAERLDKIVARQIRMHEAFENAKHRIMDKHLATMKARALLEPTFKCKKHEKVTPILQDILVKE